MKKIQELSTKELVKELTMNEKELKMREKLEEQFDLLHEESKRCEPELLRELTKSMLDIYIIFLSHDYQSSLV